MAEISDFGFRISDLPSHIAVGISDFGFRISDLRRGERLLILKFVARASALEVRISDFPAAKTQTGLTLRRGRWAFSLLIKRKRLWHDEVALFITQVVGGISMEHGFCYTRSLL